MATPSDTVENVAEPSFVVADAVPASRVALSDDDIVVVDDLPRPMPVVPKEVDVIETYLSALLDDLLGKMPAKARTSQR
jgi:hypothetical protein